MPLRKGVNACAAAINILKCMVCRRIHMASPLYSQQYSQQLEAIIDDNMPLLITGESSISLLVASLMELFSLSALLPVILSDQAFLHGRLEKSQVPFLMTLTGHHQ